MPTIDLNCDMGESFGAYKMGMDGDVMAFITSANIACGWHAGDPLVMGNTVKQAVSHGVAVGAHPGYPDLLGFGRRKMDCTADELFHYMVYQLGAIKAFCRLHGTRLQHVKPHGALYLTAVENKPVARAVAEAIVSVDADLIYVALAGAKGEMMRKIGQEVGLKVAYEAFPDRAYTPDGTLQSRRISGAVITDPEEVADRALRMAKENRIITIDGSVIDVEAQTLCVHGDTPTAVRLVARIREALEKDGITLAPMGGGD